MRIRSTLATFLLIAGVTTAQDPTKDIRSSDPLVRVLAIDALTRAGDADSQKLLLSALNDKDWEVQERAAQALGQLGTKAALKPLIDLALSGEISRLRHAAAVAVAAIDGVEAAALLTKKTTSKKTDIVACEALAQVFAKSGAGDTKKLTKLLSHKELAVREASSRAWLAGSTERAATLTELLEHRDIVVRAAALELVAQAPRDGDLDVLGKVMAGAWQNDVIERRALIAAGAALAALDESQRPAQISGFLDRIAGVRAVRLLGLLHRDKLIDTPAASARLIGALGNGEPFIRSAAAKALGHVAGAGAAAAAVARFGREARPEVRYQLLDAMLRAGGIEQHAGWLAEQLATDGEPRVRERIAVILGRRNLTGATAALTKTLDDSNWTVAVTAAVSLGKTFADDAVAPLIQLAKNADWKRRGAAVVGLMHLNRKAVVPILIEAIEDSVPMVQHAAHHALTRIAYRNDIEMTAKAWRKWWDAESARYVFTDWRKIEENRKKYGYSVPDEDIYDGLDIVVLESRGDHIENLLERLEITHRRTQAARVAEAGLHPEAIFVANCTGEIEAGDVEPLQWFVRTGGALFGSCWALHHTIERVYPGIVRKLPTPGFEVLGDVRARSCDTQSPYLNGVFPEHVVPIYHLEGAHLIDVVDPERAEVLIDSPDAAQAYGGGNLAAWFRVGHGIILDSANHFDLQGFEKVEGLKTATDRQAYAVDHMGLTYAQLREIARKGFWKTSPNAARNVPDRSAFRFLTNFVRNKRIESDD